MAVGLKLGSITDEIGTSDFFHSFFLTIAGNLEPKGWGTKFPVIMKAISFRLDMNCFFVDLTKTLKN